MDRIGTMATVKTTANRAEKAIKATGISEAELIKMFLEASVSVPFSVTSDPRGTRPGSFESTFDAMVKARKAGRK